MYKIMLTATMNILISSFPVLVHFMPLASLNALANISVTILNQCVESGHSHLILISGSIYHESHPFYINNLIFFQFKKLYKKIYYVHLQPLQNATSAPGEQ